jgi:hypothetical protein
MPTAADLPDFRAVPIALIARLLLRNRGGGATQTP